MYTVKLNADGQGLDDRVFEIKLKSIREIKDFAALVQHGWEGAGLIKPVVVVEHAGRSMQISRRNNWSVEEVLDIENQKDSENTETKEPISEEAMDDLANRFLDALK